MGGKGGRFEVGEGMGDLEGGGERDGGRYNQNTLFMWMKFSKNKELRKKRKQG